MDEKIKKRLIKDSIGVLFWKIAGALGLLAFYSVSAHAMSTAEFGQLSYLVALGMIASVLANGGLQRDAVRIGEAAYRNGSSNIFLKDMLNSVTYVLLMLALISTVLWALWKTGILKPLEWTAFLITLAFIGTRAYALFFGEIIRGLHDGRTGTAIQQSIPYLVASAIIILLPQTSNGQNALSVLLCLTVGTVIAVAVGLNTLNKAQARMNGNAGSEVNFKFGILAPFVLTDFLLAMQQQGHVMILAGVANTEEVALFSAAFRAATLVALPLSVINSSIPSTIAEMYSKNEKEKLTNILGYTSTISFVVAFLICAPLFVYSGLILDLMFGDNYAGASIAFKIMIVAQLVNVWTGSPGRVIVIAKAGKAFFLITALSVILGLGFTYTLGSHYGSIGAAIGAFISLSAHNTFMAVYCSRKLDIKSHATIKNLNLLAWKVRYAIEGRVSKNRNIRLIEKIIRTIENIIWRLQNKQVIECIGDSHSRAFRHINLIQKNYRYRAVVIQGATARGLDSINSITNSRSIALNAINGFKKKSKVVLLFGEIDCASTLWMLAQKRGVDVKLLLEETVTKYFNFAKCISNNGHSVYIISSPLPYLADEEQSSHMIKERRRLLIPLKDVMNITRLFNQYLSQHCQLTDIKFVDLDKDVIDRETGLVKSELRSKITGDHHYNRSAYAKILHNAIQMMTSHNGKK